MRNVFPNIKISMCNWRRSEPNSLTIKQFYEVLKPAQHRDGIYTKIHQH